MPPEHIQGENSENSSELYEYAAHMLVQGTTYFMAVELLIAQNDNLPTVHSACHDLESFYWLLVWLILRHTDHDHPKKRTHVAHYLHQEMSMPASMHGPAGC